MGDIFRVAIHHDDDYGYIEYDQTTHGITVVLDHPGKRDKVTAYLTGDHVINAPNQTLLDFAPANIRPTSDLASLKLALTRLWAHTGVLVDWSRPIKL